MRVPRIRFTVWTMMMVVAVVAFDCFVLVATHGIGVVLVGLVFTIGLTVCWRVRENRKLFWLWFEVAGLAMVLAYVGCLQTNRRLIAQWAQFALAHVVDNLRYGPELWHSLVASNEIIAGYVAYELSFGIPMLFVALVAGVLAELIGSFVTTRPLRQSSGTPPLKCTVALALAAAEGHATQCRQANVATGRSAVGPASPVGHAPQPGILQGLGNMTPKADL